MDPLSITASAITIAALATKTCQAFAELRALCRTLPGRLHALSNEVTDINVVLIHVAIVFQKRASAVENEQHHTISHLLKRADKKSELLCQTILELVVACDRAKLTALYSGVRLAQGTAKIENSGRGEIKTIKCSLNIALGASNS